MQFVEFSDPDTGIAYQYIEFLVGEVEFVMYFCCDEAVVSSFAVLGEDIEAILAKYRTCTLKFMAKEHLENENTTNLYAPAKHNFRHSEIIALQKRLERLIFEHYLRFAPECYIFIAERPSLNRMYQRMCAKPSGFMSEFKAQTLLGINQDCFVLITPKGERK